MQNTKVQRKIIYMQGLSRYITVLLSGLLVSFISEATVLQPLHVLERSASGIQAGHSASVVTNIASETASSEAERFFNNFGTSGIKLRTDQQLSFKDSSADLLFKLYSDNSNIVFTQFGIRHDDERLTTNLGLGHRYFLSNWLLGYNGFYDTTWQNQNSRWGAGIEAWRDYLKFSGNLYRGISGWKGSRQHSEYLERPANGWDIRAEGWLPFQPQLGARMVYEHYYGDNVALGRFSDRHRNPVSMSAGVSYTPVPLITMGFDYKSGTNDIREAHYNLGLVWRMGESLSKQLDSENVAGLRRLTGSKLDLVNRNNTVVLDYREQQKLTLQLPDEIRADEYSVQSITPFISSRHSIETLELDDYQLIAAGGKVISSSPQKITFQMPAWDRGQGTVLAAVAVDSKGNRSHRAEVRLWPVSTRHILSLTSDKLSAINDGQDAATLTLHVTDSDGQPLVNEEISLTTDGGSLSAQGGKTDTNGDFRSRITSTVPGTFHVTAIDGDFRVMHQGITFTETLNGVITANKTTALSNNIDSIQVTVKLSDARNQPVVGKGVQWATTGGTVKSTDEVTGVDGSASVILINDEPGQAIVTARTGDSSWQSPELNFREPELSLSLEPDKMHELANGFDYITYTLTAKREQSPVPVGETVSWHTDLGTLEEDISVLDTNGQARVRLKSKEQGTAIVSAKLGGHTVKAIDVQFTEVFNYFVVMPSTAKVGETITAIAHGVKDNSGNIMEGEPVYWTSDGGTLSSSVVPVNALGESHVSFSADKPGFYYVYSTIRNNTHRILVTIFP
ncbi:inverse autotransporter beta domain-containing protein [Klebsiella pneumoniae]|uniref:inverse autotransporter beta domain-containing protein n=1 Tax=Klebsiella pneumoniae TaxID=573 RepID=UPI0039B66B2F